MSKKIININTANNTNNVSDEHIAMFSGLDASKIKIYMHHISKPLEFEGPFAAELDSILVFSTQNGVEVVCIELSFDDEDLFSSFTSRYTFQTRDIIHIDATLIPNDYGLAIQEYDGSDNHTSFWADGKKYTVSSDDDLPF